MKKIFFIAILLIGSVSTISYAQSRGGAESKPLEILEAVADKANEKPEYRIQETHFDEITDQRGGYLKEYKISNTLEYIRIEIYPYLQWMVYIGLVAAVILLIYNGLMMVTNGLHNQGDMSKIKKNIINIAIGVILITGFYFILKLLVALLTSLFGGSDGSTGFK